MEVVELASHHCPLLYIPFSVTWVSHYPHPHQRGGEAQIIDLSILGLIKPLSEKVPVISKPVSICLYLSLILPRRPSHSATVTSNSECGGL